MPVSRHNWLLTSLCAVALIAPVAWGQQQQTQGQSTTPIPAYNSPFGSTETPGNEGSTASDTNALAGAQYLSLGGWGTTHSYWQPHLDIFGMADTNPSENPTTQSNWNTWTSFSGGVDIHRISGISALTVSYIGGAMYSSGGFDSGIVQGLNFDDTFSFRRSTVSFLDQLSYLPEAASGYGGITGAPLPGGALPGAGGGLGPGYSAEQTILTGRGQSLRNSFATEVDTQLTPRSSLTFVGGYSLVDYPDSSLLNFGQVAASGGYNYKVSERNTVAAVYTFNQYRYSSSVPTVDNHTFEIAFGREVTGRLAMQIAAGPQIITSSGSTVLTWSMNGSVHYRLQRTELGLTYYRWANGGSGVLPGAFSDSVSGSITRKMSRTFSSGIIAGYARNESLAIGTAPSSSRYNYWYAGASFSHPWGPSLALTFSYQMQYQDSNASFCVGPSCGTNLIRHLISVGLGWHERPLRF